MSWISDKEKERWAEHMAQQERYLMGIDPIPEHKSDPHDNKKWAWIEVAGERQTQWVDNVTMKAYEKKGYSKTDIEIPEYTFERWCRGMDL